MKEMKILRQNLKKGFTIIELLVAMAVTVILVTVLLQLTTTSGDVLTSTQNKVDLSRKANRIFDVMERDINSMVIRRDESDWFYAGTPHDEGDNPPNYINNSGVGELEVRQEDGIVGTTGDFSFPNVGTMVFFTSPVDRYDGLIGELEDAGGDVSFVEYELDYRSVINSIESGGTVSTNINENARPAFFRWQEFPDSTFKLLSSAGATALEKFHSADYDKQQTFSVLSSQVYSVTHSFSVAYDGGVGSIVLTPHQANGGGNNTTALRISRNAGLVGNATEFFEERTTGSGRYLEGWGVRADRVNLRITGVTVSLTFLDQQGLDYLRLVADGSISGAAVSMTREELINRHGQSFSRTMKFPDY